MCLAIPGQILDIIGTNPLERRGRVSFAGVVREINLTFTPDAEPGDWVVVHTGVALNKLDEEEARATLDLFRQIESQQNSETESP